MTLVFVPLDRAELSSWATSGRRAPGPGFAPTPAFRQAFGFGAADDEAAEYTVLCVAGVSCLMSSAERLVAVALADPAATEDEFGRVSLPELPFTAVTSLFSEGSPVLARGVQRALAGLDLDGAWDDAQVEKLLSQGDLLWHGPAEWGTLV